MADERSNLSQRPSPWAKASRKQETCGPVHDSGEETEEVSEDGERGQGKGFDIFGKESEPVNILCKFGLHDIY